MTSREPQRKYTGNFALYRFCYIYRQPLFLQRNIRKSLQYHRQSCERVFSGSRHEMKSSSQTTPSSRRTAPRSESPSPDQWTTEELIQILSNRSFGPQDPVLRIDVTDIKDRFAKFRDNKNDNGPPAKQARTKLIRASCALTIWDASSPKQPTIVEQTRKCNIHGKTLPSEERGASIELESPFLIRLDELQTQRPASAHTAPEIQFSMQLVVMVANEHDSWPPVNMTRVPEPKTKSYRDSSGLVRFPVLAAKWHKLPRCPRSEAESTLDLIASQDNIGYRPKLGLKINAEWIQSPSPLESFNNDRRSRLRQSPIPSIYSEVSRDQKTTVTVEWTFEGLARHIPPLQLHGYECPFCPGKDFTESSLFHFHLINSHSLFTYKFTLEYTSDQGQSVAIGKIKVDVSDEYEPEQKGNSLIDWEKPKTPFDLEAYLKGDDSWLGKKTKRVTNLLLTHSPSTPRTPRSRSHDASKMEIPLSVVMRDAADVPDIAAPRKRKFAVPKAPDENTRFFRLITKRPLEEGEMVSESDDDIDEEWILQKHADTIDSFTDTTREEKEFIQRFDRHMLTEDISSDLHSREALIRFCRKNRKWLQEKAMKLEFHKKAATLKIQGCISRTTIMDCIKIIEEPFPKDDPDAMEIESLLATPDRVSAALLSELNAAEAGDIYGRCAVCYVGITHPRTHIFCTNPICLKPDYHLGCASLEQRKSNWLCSVCVTNTPPHSTPPQTFHDAQSSPDAKRALPIRNVESSPDSSDCTNKAKSQPSKSKRSQGRKLETKTSNQKMPSSSVETENSNVSSDEFMTDDSPETSGQNDDDGDEYVPDDREEY